MLKIILIAIPAIIVLCIIIVAMQPSSYRVMRAIATGMVLRHGELSHIGLGRGVASL